jgi:hypothetical protein
MRQSWTLDGPCPNCGFDHESWTASAACRWRRGLLWVGVGPMSDVPCFALISSFRQFWHEPRCRIVTLWRTREQAEGGRRGVEGSAGPGTFGWRHRVCEGRPCQKTEW